MKLLLKSAPVKTSSTRGTKTTTPKASTLGGPRTNFFPGVVLLDKMQKLYERGKALKVPRQYTKSLILREGAVLYIQQQNDLISRAEKGTLHAKLRK